MTSLASLFRFGSLLRQAIALLADQMACAAGMSSVVSGISRPHHVAPAARTPIVAFKAMKAPGGPVLRRTLRSLHSNQSAFRNVRLTRRCPSFGCSPSLSVETP